MTPTFVNHTSSTLLDIAESDHSVFIQLDKTLLHDKRVRKLLQSLQKLREEFKPVAHELPPLDASHIPYVSAEEQAELDRILDSMTDEDREVVETEHIIYDQISNRLLAKSEKVFEE